MSYIPTLEQARELLGRYNKEAFHLRHAEIVSGVLGWYAAQYDPEKVEYWKVVGMLHDLVKCRCYRSVNLLGTKFEYVQPEYHGHGACSVSIAAELGVRLMREEIAAIMFHMGPWGVGKEYSEEEFRAAMKAFAPYIIATHTADWYAAEVDEMEAGK